MYLALGGANYSPQSSVSLLSCRSCTAQAGIRSTLTLTLVAPFTDFSKLVIVHAHGQRRFDESLRL